MSYERFKRAEKEGWDARAKVYDDITGQITTQAIPTLLAMAETAPGMRVLDLCCGTGRAAGAAAALGARAEGIDISPAMIAAATEAFPNVTFEVGDAEAIARADGAYDEVIWSFGAMHVGSPEAVFAEIARVLTLGGRAAISHWVGPPDSPFFRTVFGTLKSLADMSVVPEAPPPFALSSEVAMTRALEQAGFEYVTCKRIPLIFQCPAGSFAEHFRAFAARAAVILDRQDPAVLREIHKAWDEQLDAFQQDGAFRIPMPALAVSAVRAR